MANKKITELEAITEADASDLLAVVNNPSGTPVTKKITVGNLFKNLFRYGVSWNESADSYTRTGLLAGIATGSSPDAALIPIQAAMRRCILQDDGSVAYYLDPSDSTKRVGGGSANLDGSDGQVMVEIPKFYYYYAYSGTTHTWEISLYPLDGFSVHPAFIKNGEAVDYRYIGAYEGVLYDVSATLYANGIQLPAGSTTFTVTTNVISRTGESHPFSLLEVGDKIVVAGTTNNNATFTIATGGTGDQSITVEEALTTETADATIETEKDFPNDILASVSGKAPINYGTRANFRTIAGKRGTGWRQQDFDIVSAIQLLFLTEYADWNSQSMIGNGLTDWVSATWTSWNDYNPIETSGNSNSDGNATANNSAGSGNTGSYMSYRGIESFFGHIWEWVDGVNVQFGTGDDYTGQPYVSNNDSNFADDTATDYTPLSRTIPGKIGGTSQNDYQKTLCQQGRGLLPASTGGSSSTYICDYYYQSTGWRVAKLGGYAYSGLAAGVAFWSVFGSSGDRGRNFGGRLAF